LQILINNAQQFQWATSNSVINAYDREQVIQLKEKQTYTYKTTKDTRPVQNKISEANSINEN